jgi:hypothetical protein
MKALRRWTEGLCASEVPSLWLPLAPIVSVASEYARLPSLKQHLAAIAIVFDFVNPVLALWRMIDRGSKLGRDKAKTRNRYVSLPGAIPVPIPHFVLHKPFGTARVFAHPHSVITIMTK